MDLENLTAEKRVEFILNNFEKEIVLTSSFGAQSAVLLHMLLNQNPNLKVVFLDTQYLFPETYQFVNDLKNKLNINLYTYKSLLSKNEQEKKYGKLWLQGKEGLEKYNYINKIEPMERAIKELNIKTWISGIRKNQSKNRTTKNFIELKNEIIKAYPILDWTDKDIYLYLKKHDLPYHPLWHKGYISIGDVHSTKSINEVNSIEEIRFNGLQRECGLHL